MSVNQVVILGYVGAEPKVTRLDNGACVAKFSVATSEKWTDKKGEKQEVTTWHSVELWRGIAEVAEKYLHKGDKVYIQGKLKNNSYDDKDGKKVYQTYIVGETMELLGQKPNTTATPETQAESVKPVDNTPAIQPNTSFDKEQNNDLPF